MKASEKQKRTFDKAFDKEWRKLFIHLMDRKTAILGEVLKTHELRTVDQNETKFFEELARDGMIYWLDSYIQDQGTELMKESLKADKDITDQINQILKKPPLN